MVRPRRRSNHLSGALGGIIPAMFCHRSVWLLLVLLHCVTAVDNADYVNVRTQYGELIGVRTRGKYDHAGGLNISGHDQFLGTPYAAPPVGDRRFQPPEEPWRWQGARKATSYGKVCPQFVFSADTAIENQSEDCLFLDIYSPFEDAHPLKEYPVFIFFHGGSYEVGSGRLYDGSVLVQYGVVVVSVSYRLGALGFMTSGDSRITGNNGLLDQIEAMKWVKANIRAFRGDPDHVTIVGHSVGAASVGLMLIIPQTKDLFHRVIAMSGSATALYSDGYPPDTDHHEYVRQVSDLFGCPRNAEDFRKVVECLRKVPARSFITKRENFPRYDPIDPEFRPFIDGEYITDRPRNLFVEGKFRRVPVITGTVTDEFGNYFNGGERHALPFDAALDKHLLRFVGSEQLAWIARHFYTDWQQPYPVYDRGDLLSDLHMVAPTTDISDLISGHSTPVYQYHIDLEPSFHSVELNYLFGTPFSGKFVDEMSENGQGNISIFTETDKAFSRRIMQLWTSFAADGYPSMTSESKNSTKWQPYRGFCRDYAYLTPIEDTNMKQSLRSPEVAFWNQIIPKLKGESGFIEGGQPKWTVNMWILIVVVVVLLVLLLLATVLYVRTSLRLHRQRRGYGSKPRPTKV